CRSPLITYVSATCPAAARHGTPVAMDDASGLRQQPERREAAVNLAATNLFTGWTCVLGGVVSGVLMGLFFHKDEWLGGYSSFRRRLLRLGHIAFFGLGFLNLAFAMSVVQAPISPALQRVASIALVVGALAMPLCCFLTAWRRPFRHLFPL